jgi:hypothetical protein
MPNDQAIAKQRAQSLGRVIARTWTDEAFKKELLADPVRVLAANGVAVPKGTAVKVLEDSNAVNHLVLPPKPADLNLSDFTASDNSWCWSYNILSGCF